MGMLPPTPKLDLPTARDFQLAQVALDAAISACHTDVELAAEYRHASQSFVTLQLEIERRLSELNAKPL